MTDQRMDDRLRAAGDHWRATVAADTNDRSEPLDLLDTHRPRRRRLVTILSAAAVIVLVAVGASLLATRDDKTTSAPSNSVPAALRGVTWTDPAARSTIVFLDRAVRVDDGCTVTYRLYARSSTMSIGRHIGAKVICGPGLGPANLRLAHAARRFDRVVLNGTFDWSLDGHVLHLAARGTTIALTTDGKPAPNIEHQTWRLAGVDDARGRLVENLKTVTLTFDQGGPLEFHGSDGCNTISGDVRSTLTTITFVQPKISLMGCGPESPETKVIDTLLAGATDYRILDDELILSRPGYDGLLVYTAVR